MGAYGVRYSLFIIYSWLHVFHTREKKKTHQAQIEPGHETTGANQYQPTTLTCCVRIFLLTFRIFPCTVIRCTVTSHLATYVYEYTSVWLPPCWGSELVEMIERKALIVSLFTNANDYSSETTISVRYKHMDLSM